MLSRRAFLGGAAATVVAGCSTPESPGDAPSIPIIDTHQHLWDLERFRLPWLSGRGPLVRNHLPEDYREAFRGIPIEQAVYMEVDVAADQKVAEAEYILGLCGRSDSLTRAA